MNTKIWSSEKNWWTQDTSSFNSVWQAVVARYAKNIAYFKNDQACSFYQLEQDAIEYRNQFSQQAIIRINGLDSDWLTQAIAAWTLNKLVVIYNPDWRDSDPVRYQLAMSCPEHLNEISHPHLLLFTSGTTGIPKPIIRKTSLALFEAASYIEDISAEKFDSTICFIKPWFGAMTKHCLGMLFAGVPQYFQYPNHEMKNQKILVYGTPSLISQHIALCKEPWHALSLTGEVINACHIQDFKKCLNSDGFVMDAYGATECGVIARRKMHFSQLDSLVGKGFEGEILPGKKISIQESSLLSVKALDEAPILTGDIAKVKGNRLFLQGRLSAMRKIRGVWLDTSPLFILLATHPHILHAELAPEQAENGQLIVYVNAHQLLNIHDLYQWLFKHLVPIKLMPQIIFSYQLPQLSITGKQSFSIESTLPEPKIENFISMLCNAIIHMQKQDFHEHAFMNESFESNGLDSIDIISLIHEIEKKTGKFFPGHSLLKTDTPQYIANIIRQENRLAQLRKIGITAQSQTPQVLYIGTGMNSLIQKLSPFAQLMHTDIINCQKEPFRFSELAESIIEENFDFFSNSSKLYLMGYSINALLAIEIAYQLEKINIPVQGILLLDPPHFKRARSLKRKKYWLLARSKFINQMIKSTRLNGLDRYHYELRKLAISQQPQYSLKTPSLTMYSLHQFTQNPWLSSSKHHESLELNFEGHLELINTPEGIQSWLNLAYEFLIQ